MSRFQITVKFCTNSICRYRHSFLGHFMLEFIGTVLIHKKNYKKNSAKKSLIVRKTVHCSICTNTGKQFLAGFSRPRRSCAIFPEGCFLRGRRLPPPPLRCRRTIRWPPSRPLPPALPSPSPLVPGHSPARSHAAMATLTARRAALPQRRESSARETAPRKLAWRPGRAAPWGGGATVW